MLEHIEVSDEFLGNLREWYLRDVDLMPLDEVEQQVHRTCENVERNLEFQAGASRLAGSGRVAFRCGRTGVGRTGVSVEGNQQADNTDQPPLPPHSAADTLRDSERRRFLPSKLHTCPGFEEISALEIGRGRRTATEPFDEDVHGQGG